MSPEGEIKKQVRLLLHENNIHPFAKSLSIVKSHEPLHGYYLMPSVNGYGEAGIGDFLVCLAGHYFEIETKGGGRHRGIQRAHEEVVCLAGGSYMLVRTENDLDMLGHLLKTSLDNHVKLWAEGRAIAKRLL